MLVLCSVVSGFWVEEIVLVFCAVKTALSLWISSKQMAFDWFELYVAQLIRNGNDAFIIRGTYAVSIKVRIMFVAIPVYETPKMRPWHAIGQFNLICSSICYRKILKIVNNMNRAVVLIHIACLVRTQTLHHSDMDAHFMICIFAIIIPIYTACTCLMASEIQWVIKLLEPL